jgi:hypothetical protein
MNRLDAISSSRGPAPEPAAAATDALSRAAADQPPPMDAARDSLIMYPRVERLPGRLPDKIVEECLALAGGDPERLRAALGQMILHGKRPDTSWMWFPTVLRHYLKPPSPK